MLAALFATCLATLSSTAQSLDRQLVASTGSTATSANFQLDFSVGDLVVSTATSANYLLTQGFHQSTDFSTSIPLIAAEGNDLFIFPNPTRDAITLQWSRDPLARYAVRVFDLLGQCVMSVGSITGNQRVLDLSALAAGAYSVHVLPEDGAPIMLRVQKVN